MLFNEEKFVMRLISEILTPREYSPRPPLPNYLQNLGSCYNVSGHFLSSSVFPPIVDLASMLLRKSMEIRRALELIEADPSKGGKEDDNG